MDVETVHDDVDHQREPTKLHLTAGFEALRPRSVHLKGSLATVSAVEWPDLERCDEADQHLALACRDFPRAGHLRVFRSAPPT